jgi:hypothetical protein
MNGSNNCWSEGGTGNREQGTGKNPPLTPPRRGWQEAKGKRQKTIKKPFVVALSWMIFLQQLNDLP